MSQDTQATFPYSEIIWPDFALYLVWDLHDTHIGYVCHALRRISAEFVFTAAASPFSATDKTKMNATVLRHDIDLTCNQGRKSSWTEMNELNWTWTEAIDSRAPDWTERTGNQAGKLNWTNSSWTIWTEFASPRYYTTSRTSKQASKQAQPAKRTILHST